MHHVASRIGGHANRRRHKHHRARKRARNPKQIPRFLERVPPFHSDVEHGNRPPAPPRQNHGSGLCHESRPARPINRERYILALFEALAHHRKPLDRATRRTPLRRTKSQPFDHPPRPLPVEVHRVHHHDSPPAPNPNRRKNAAVPERANRRFLRVTKLHRIVHTDNLDSQRRPNQPHHPIDRPRNNGYLHAPPARKLRHRNCRGRASARVFAAATPGECPARCRVVVHCGIV
jgi:hypothetical protein